MYLCLSVSIRVSCHPIRLVIQFGDFRVSQEQNLYALQPDFYLTSGGESIVQTQTLSFIVVATLLFVALRKLWFGKR